MYDLGVQGTARKSGERFYALPAVNALIPARQLKILTVSCTILGLVLKINWCL